MIINNLIQHNQTLNHRDLQHFLSSYSLNYTPKIMDAACSREGLLRLGELESCCCLLSVDGQN
jgi:hypothetical protein